MIQHVSAKDPGLQAVSLADSRSPCLQLQCRMLGLQEKLLLLGGDWEMIWPKEPSPYRARFMQPQVKLLYTPHIGVGFQPQQDYEGELNWQQ